MAVKKQKNVVEKNTIEAQGAVNIGDRTKQTFNVYGMDANQIEIKFFAKCFVFLLALFGILAVVFVYWPNPKERLAVFFLRGIFRTLFIFFNCITTHFTSAIY